MTRIADVNGADMGMRTGDDIPTERFETGRFEPCERADAWHQFMEPIGFAKPLCDNPSDVRLMTRSWLIGAVIAGQYAEDGVLVKKTKIHAERSRGYLSVRHYKAGHSRGLLNDTFYSTAQGNIHFMDRGCHWSKC